MTTRLLSRRRNLILISVAVAVVGGVVTTVTQVLRLNRLIEERLRTGAALPAVEIYAPEITLKVGRAFRLNDFETAARAHEWQTGRDFVSDTGEACRQMSPPETPLEAGDRCLYIKDSLILAVWGSDGFVKHMWRGDPPLPTTAAELFPRLVTQLHDGQPVLRQTTELGGIPVACLQAVTAIEDRDFLNHRGVSPTGTLRAVWRNLRQRRWAEGGSTITQQLVKNFFLTPTKTLGRKIEEQILALLLEAQISKDRILELYLNVIYMGQSGPSQIRGWASAADEYFGTPLDRLDLGECALLAGLVNNPGRLNPFVNPAPARARRELVLLKMREAGMIDSSEQAQANAKDLPTQRSTTARSNAPYLALAALKEFTNQQPDVPGGTKLHIALDREVQAQIELSLAQQLPRLEKRIRRPATQPLQAAIVTVDLSQNQIVGLVGGRGFKQTQFNRAVDGKRQIGSIVKPFVYWPALVEGDALTAADDSPFEWKTGVQTWRPRNFEKEFRGRVPYFYALAKSLNVPTARVGQTVGLKRVAQTLNSAGLSSAVPMIPALTLGAVELSLVEVAQIYSTLARNGFGAAVHAVNLAEDKDSNPISIGPHSADPSLIATTTAQVVGMMTQTFVMGTARGVAKNLPLSGEYAGKTGTTSDTRDAWFVGFDGRLLTAVWVGYDDNTPLGLTGAGAALPIWSDIIFALAKIYAPAPLALPEGTEWRDIGQGELQTQFPNLSDLPDKVRLIFKK